MRVRPQLLGFVAALGLGAVTLAACRHSASPSQVGLAGIPPLPLISTGERARFVGSAACAGCHARESELHAHTSHARTAPSLEQGRARDAFRTTQTLADPLLAATYSYAEPAGKPQIRIKPAGKAEVTLTPRYAFGSGRIGITFLAERGGGFLEARTSYYPDGRWHWTPGQQHPDPHRDPAGRALDFNTAAACFLCHSTAVVRDGERLRPEDSILNVGCERCHGPGAAHIAAVKSGRTPGPIYSLRGLSAGQVQQLCAGCHAAPEQLPDAQMQLHPNLPRFAGATLALSRCYREGNGGLSCLSCHNPHDRPSSNLASYEPVCLRCHTAGKAGQKACPVNATSGCVGCHMPKRPVTFPVPAAFRTHWIKPYPPQTGRDEIPF